MQKYYEEFSRYFPRLTRRDDFNEFWLGTRRLSDAVPLMPQLEPYNYPSSYIDVYAIKYAGFDGTVINGWYMVPRVSSRKKYPCLISYHGYGGNCGMPSDFLQWIMMDVAVISVDCRGQCGNTGDSAKYSSGTTQSCVCHGILDKNEYYYRAVYMDCIRAIDFACSMEEVDTGRIIIEGGSQGGALGMAVCALDERPYLAMVDVPGNSNIEKRIEGSHGSFSYVTEYLKVFPDRVDRVFETLSYFDTMNMADRIRCKVLASVALKDEICPAMLYFATYNRITSEKHIKIYPFNGHEGGGKVHNEIKMRFLKENL